MNGSETISSKDNERLKHARQVRDGKVKNEIFIEGKRLAAEALRSDLTIKYCFVSAAVSLDETIESQIGRSKDRTNFRCRKNI